MSSKLIPPLFIQLEGLTAQTDLRVEEFSFHLLFFHVATVSEDQQNTAATDTGEASLNMTLSVQVKVGYSSLDLSELIPLLFTSVFTVFLDEINIILLR